MFDIPDTPDITSTSPSSARLCASNSAMRLTWVSACNGLERCLMLRTVSAGPTRSFPAASVQHAGADCTFRNAKLVHHVRDQAAAFAKHDEATHRAVRRLWR